MRKILITGSQGQLGKALNKFYADNQEVQLINTDVGELDITNEEAVMEKVLSIHPDVIINFTKQEKKVCFMTLIIPAIIASALVITLTILKRKIKQET